MNEILIDFVRLLNEGVVPEVLKPAENRFGKPILVRTASKILTWLRTEASFTTLYEQFKAQGLADEFMDSFEEDKRIDLHTISVINFLPEIGRIIDTSDGTIKFSSDVAEHERETYKRFALESYFPIVNWH